MFCSRVKLSLRPVVGGDVGLRKVCLFLCLFLRPLIPDTTCGGGGHANGVIQLEREEIPREVLP